MLQDVINKLRADHPTYTIESGYKTGMAAGSDDATPELYVTPARNIAASDSLVDNCVVQMIKFSYDVCIACHVDLFDTVQNQVFTSLIGFSVNQFHGPLQYQGGERIQLNGQRILWVDNFAGQKEFREQ